MKKLLLISGLGLLLGSPAVFPVFGQFALTPVSNGLNFQTQGSFQSAYQNIPYSGTAVCTGGKSPYTISVFSGSLPTLITQSGSSGTFTGTPTGTGTSSFTLLCTDSTGASKPLPTAITVNTLSSVLVTLTKGSLTAAGNQTISAGQTLQLFATGTWTNSVSFDITTQATWAPTSFGTGGGVGLHTGLVTAGSSAVTPSVTATFNGTPSPGNTITVTVSAPSPVIQTASLPNCHAGIVYPATQITESGGTGPFTYDFQSGSLTGAGLSMSSSGLITGTCLGTTQSPTFRVTDSLAHTGTKALTVSMQAETSTTVALSPTSVNVGGTSQATATAHYADGATFNVSNGGAGIGNIIVWPPGYSASATSIDIPTTSPAFPAGALEGICLYSGNANTTVFTITNTPAQAMTLLGNNTVNGFGDSQNAAYAPNSAALTNVHVAASGTANQLGAIVFAVPGIAISSPLETSVQNATVAAVTSLLSGALTTSNPSDILVNCFVATFDETSFTATAPFVIPANGTNTRGAIATQIVSAAQSMLTTSMNFSPNPDSAASTFMAFKAAASGNGGASWASNDANSSVSSNGLVTALAAPNSVIQATFQGNSGTATLTINPTADSSLGVACNPSSLSVGGTVQCTAIGQPSGTVYTNSATWSSTSPPVATVNSTGLVTGVSNGSATITARISTGLSGTAPITVGTAQSLLNNCNALAGNGMTCATPTGWSIGLTCTFETDSCGGAAQFGGNGQRTCTGQAHTGGCSWVGAVPTNSGGNVSPDVNWTVNASQASVTHDVVIHSWAYVDPNGHVNTESNFFNIQNSDPVHGWQLVWNTQNQCPNSLCTNWIPTLFSDFPTQTWDWQCAGIGNVGPTSGPPGNCNPTVTPPAIPMNLGTWEEEEAQIHINTCTGSNGNGDGYMNLFINGQKVNDHITFNMVDCSNTALTPNTISVGGVWTYFVPNTSAFNVYHDDIIILHK